MATQIDPNARFFYLDTDVLFPETYETRDRLEERYGIKFHRYSSMTLEQQAGLLRRPALGARPRRLLRDPQGGSDALGAVGGRLLGSGIRRQDSQTRAKAPKFAWDKRFDLWKLNPLADWSEKDVWRYISRARHSLQPAPRPGLSLDRLHPLHPQAGRGRGPARGPLGGHLEDRVRAARLSFAQGTNYVNFATLPRFMATTLQLNERQTADFEMIGNGGFAPLTGPQGSADWKSVVEKMTLADGEYWPIPITLATDLEVSEGDTVEITSDEGKELGTPQGRARSSSATSRPRPRAST